MVFCGLIFTSMNTESLGQIIRRRRRELDVDQRKLARLAEVSVHTVSDIESGKGNPTISTVDTILAVLGLKLTVRANTPAGAHGVDNEIDGDR